MSGFLPKQPGDFYPISSSTRVAIIGSMWHDQYVQAMINRAQSELQRLGMLKQNIAVYRAPGCVEIPLIARMLFETQAELSAILAFGVILKGGTTHNETVLQQVVQGFSLVSDRFGKPIINEVIGVCDLADAAARAGDDDSNKGLEAVFALSEYLHVRDLIHQSGRAQE